MPVSCCCQQFGVVFSLGTQNSLDYVQSLRTFVSDSSDSLIEMIEDLIDNKTGGKHSQVKLSLLTPPYHCLALMGNCHYSLPLLYHPCPLSPSLLSPHCLLIVCLPLSLLLYLCSQTLPLPCSPVTPKCPLPIVSIPQLLSMFHLSASSPSLCITTSFLICRLRRH